MPDFNIVSQPVCHRYGHHQLANKLDPMFFPEMTPEFAAIVGFVVNAGYTRPILCEVSLDAGFVVAAFSGTERCALFTYEFLRRNWLGLLDAAGLTPDEHMEAECIFASRIGRDGMNDA